MEKAKLELVVGIFVLVGIACLAYLSIKLGKLELIGGDVYEVEAQFNTATGLKPGASIEIAGVEVGRVKDITLKDDRAVGDTIRDTESGLDLEELVSQYVHGKVN